MNFKGSLPLLILHTLSQGPNHGYAIASSIRELSNGILTFSEGTLYPTLHGLEERGLIKSLSEPTREGRPRLRYQLTRTGQQALERERDSWQRYSQAVSAVLDLPARRK